MKSWKNLLPAFIILFLAPAFSAHGKDFYVPCPRGLFRCGEMKWPPKANGRKVHCHDAEMQQIMAHIGQGKSVVDKVAEDQRQVVSALNDLGGLYSKYPAKKKYLQDLAASIQKDLIDGFIKRLQEDLKRASTCIWDDKYKRGGCRYIPDADCYDRGSLESAIAQLIPLSQKIIDDLNYNRAMLLSGLPETLLMQGQVVQCTKNQPPCPQHMGYSIDLLIEAEKAIQKTVLGAVSPPPSGKH